MAVQLARRHFSRTDYHRMAEAGILGVKDRVELIEGEILEMSPIGRKHLACLDRLNRSFVTALGEAAVVRVGGSIVLNEWSEPQPDLVLLHPRDDFYATMDAIPDAVFLVVEVADSSIDYDQRVKAPLYARRGIPELWVVDVGRERVIVYRDPTESGYSSTRIAGRGGSISPAAFPDLVIAVDNILG